MGESQSPESRLKANEELLALIKKLNYSDESENWIGPYAVTRTLGEGATGVVKLAYHRDRPEEIYALKIVDKAALLHKPEEKKRVEREIRILQKIEHPHIMKLYDVLETSSHRYLVLEYLPQGELYDNLLKNGRVPVDTTFKYFFQLIMAVSYLHRNSICHRDIKLENLILDHKGDIKVADFGMAVVVPPGARLQESVGSPHYACPQIIMGQKYNGYEADVWSCGVVLFTLLTGTMPFTGESNEVLHDHIKNARYRVPVELPDSAQELLAKILTIAPEERATLRDIQDHPWWTMRCTRITPEMSKAWAIEYPPQQRPQ
eukprot:NODE_906_length_1242_cov_152.031014_g674_i0.p1 GENE.NODE_906_length_1242_cov_152.031014_g674_i0~~NODE_906_length_1242_cov_152.031014_g674_i0.p1  ORF type:complete len:318 (-),score=47.71 NODE_906_length_1242_cov_152.031014_g674_i0:206-1159(-)